MRGIGQRRDSDRELMSDMEGAHRLGLITLARIVAHPPDSLDTVIFVRVVSCR